MVEGNKAIRELTKSNYKIQEIFSVDPDLEDFGNNSVIRISEAELKKISFLQHPKDSVALVYLDENPTKVESKINLILDGIQDPGNLGTIIRLADWFGIPQIICSDDTVDFYNPKVIQATMGSFTRVNILYTDIQDFLKESANVALGTDMNGSNIYQFNFPEEINLVLGNEGNGMRGETEKLLDETISIPRFGDSQSTESLNVAVAAGIILGEIFSRR